MNKYLLFILENVLTEEDKLSAKSSLDSPTQETAPDLGSNDISPPTNGNGLGLDSVLNNNPQESPGDSREAENKNTMQAPPPPKTPEQLVLNAADETAKKTKDVPTIFKAVKEKIQNQYSDLNKAMAIVTALRNKNSLEMKAVAQRLEQFLKAGK